MKNTKVAHRYAKSLLGLATERNEADRVEHDFSVISKVLRETRDLRVFLKSPVVKSDKKQQVLLAIFGEHVGELMMAFLRILTVKGREMLLKEIAESYVEQIRRRKGIMVASVVTASALADESRDVINHLVTELNEGGDIVLTEEVDPEIVGGFVLKIEDKMVDASVLSQFRKLRRQYTKNLYEAAM